MIFPRQGAVKKGHMFEEYERTRRKQVSQMKSLMDYGMGLLILASLFDVKAGKVPSGHQILLRRAL